jgi:hypothetical protein
MGGWEGVAIAIATIAAIAAGIVLLVKGLGRLNRDQGERIERERTHEEDAKARTRFYTAARRALSSDAKRLAGRWRARARRVLLRKDDSSKPK